MTLSTTNISISLADYDRLSDFYQFLSSTTNTHTAASVVAPSTNFFWRMDRPKHRRWSGRIFPTTGNRGKRTEGIQNTVSASALKTRYQATILSQGNLAKHIT
jgi:hypothetical protein